MSKTLGIREYEDVGVVTKIGASSSCVIELNTESKMPNNETFSHLISHVRVADYEVWRTGFDVHKTERLAAGLHERHIFANAADAREFFVLFETSNAVATRAFIDSTSLAAFKDTLGLTAKPSYSFVNAISASAPGEAVVAGGVLDLVHAATVCVDAMDSRGFGLFFADEGRFQLANLPEALGPTAVTGFVGAFFSQLNSISHEIQESFETNDTASLRGLVTYDLKDGRTIQLPFSSFYRVNEARKFTHWQAYLDIGPLTPHA